MTSIVSQAFIRTSLGLCIFALAVAGCSMPSGPATKTAATASGELSDGEILQVLVDLNNGEIRQAKLVQEKSDNPELQQTAQQIIQDHTRANQNIDHLLESGITLDKSPLSRGMAMQTEQVREELAELSGQEFDCTFLEKQIEQHELALETVRSDLQPDADDQRVQQLLSRVAPALEHHLQAAREEREDMAQCPA